MQVRITRSAKGDLLDGYSFYERQQSGIGSYFLGSLNADIGAFTGVRTMHRLVEDKHQDIDAICRRFDVRRLEVFGSAARGVDFQPDTSDVDFLVEFDPASRLPPLDVFFGLQAELSSLLGRPVDLVEAGAVRNPYVLASIERNREVVYAA